jgi:hypothetical protein
MKVFFASVTFIALVACQTPEIIEPNFPPGTCNPNIEITCQGGGCCIAETQECGPETPGCSVPDSCCATGYNPQPPLDSSKRRITRQRHPQGVREEHIK